MTSAELFEHYQYLARACAAAYKRRTPPQIAYDELHAAALEGIWKASLSWQPGRVPFPNYARVVARRCMIDHLRFLHLHLYTYDDMYTLSDRRRGASEIDDREEAEALLAKHSEPLRSLLRDYFLDGINTTEIVRRRGMSKATVSRWLSPFITRAGLGHCRGLPGQTSRGAA